MTGGTKRGVCLTCGWKSRYSNSIIGAMFIGIKHANDEHPEAEGFIVAVEVGG